MRVGEKALISDMKVSQNERADVRNVVIVVMRRIGFYLHGGESKLYKGKLAGGQNGDLKTSAIPWSEGSMEDGREAVSKLFFTS